MSKVSFWIWLLLPLHSVFGQIAPDTLKRHGFQNFNEARDSIWARLAAKKVGSMKEFSISYEVFTAETRKHDTAIANEMIYGEWQMYWYHIDKSFKKVHAILKKEKLDFRRAKMDTLLVYTNTGSEDLQRAELYFYRNKRKALVRFELWKVNGLWYLNGRFDFVDDPLPVKRF